MIPDRLVLATGNPGKVDELRTLVRDWGRVDALDLRGFPGVALPEESAPSYVGNAVAKARAVANATGLPALADDSGLEVEALGGEPGVRSARYAGRGAGDEDNNRLLLSRLRGVRDRRARFVCVAALSRDGRLVRAFRGELEGLLLEAPRGEGGFGYDPLFLHPPLGTTLAELDAGRKLMVSHRGRALAAMFQFLNGGARAETR